MSAKPAARKDDTANHVPAAGWSIHQITEGSSNVRINSKDAARKDDKLTDHSDSSTTHFPDDPVPKISAGSSSVFINSKPAARKDDAVDCSSKILVGSGNVNVGG